MKKEHFDSLSEHLSDETEGDYKYKNPKTGEIFRYSRKGIYRKDGTVLVYKGKAETDE